MQMHESKGNAARSGTTSNHKSSNNNNNNRSINNTSNNQTSSVPNNNNNSKKSRNKNSRDRNPDNDAKPAPVMSNLSSYLIDEDHIDDQESINVGNLIIDLESDLEKEKNEIEQANNNNVKSNICSTINASNAPSSTSSSASLSPFVSTADIGKIVNSNSSSSSNKATSSTTGTEISNRSGGKFNQKSSNKHSTSSSTAANSSIIAASNNGHTSSTTRTVFKSSADERGELKMKITRETKPAKSDHRVAASSNQKSPTCSSSSSSNNTNNPSTHLSNFEDSCTTYDTSPSKSAQLSSISSTKECGTSTSVGTITEPECLGPCEPGTSVTLEGIVWQETDGGILVVNVTWRGKTYVGALLDCTRHDWAPPRLCDSPASDIDSKTSKNVRTKRIVTRSNGIGLDDKNLLQTTGKLRNGKGRRIPSSNDPASCSKKQREPTDKPTNENSSNQSEVNASLPGGEAVSSITNSETVPTNVDTISASTNQQDLNRTSNISTDNAGPNSPMLIGCSEPNCSKKYRNMNGLLYHQTHAHGGDSESNAPLDDNCSSSTKEKSSKPLEEPKEDDQMDTSDRISLDISEQKDSPTNEPQASGSLKRERTPSPQISIKISNKVALDSSKAPIVTEDSYLSQESSSRPGAVRSVESERRHSSNSTIQNSRTDELNRRSPGASNRHLSDFQSHMPTQAPSSLHHQNHPTTPSSKPSSNGPKQSINNQPPPLPATTEEGMKPSGTSTGPPPAPHQANCYFNSAFLANTFNPYALPPYFPRNMYDQIAPPVLTPTSNPAFISRFMNSMRNPPPPESPSRMLSPSMPKNLPFPPFKVEPGAIPPPLVATSMANPPLSNLPPMPPIGTSGPIPPPPLRMPSQGDPMLPPTSQPPFLPHGPGLNSALLRLPGSANPLGPGGPQMPSLVDDPLKQFPRRFN